MQNNEKEFVIGTLFAKVLGFFITVFIIELIINWQFFPITYWKTFWLVLVFRWMLPNNYYKINQK